MLAETVATQPYLRAALYLFLLILGLALCFFALIRLGRRYRERLLHQPDKPTPVQDIWAMHKLPEDDQGEEPRGQEP